MEPRKILLVEDEEGIINIEKAYLEKAGFRSKKRWTAMRRSNNIRPSLLT